MAFDGVCPTSDFMRGPGGGGGGLVARPTWILLPNRSAHFSPSAIGYARGNGGVFARRGHGANSYVAYPGNTLENHPPTYTFIQNSIGGTQFRTLDPRQASD